jgi:hypothetical protein
MSSQTPIFGFPPITIPHPARDVKAERAEEPYVNLQHWLESGSREYDNLLRKSASARKIR